MRQSAIVLGAGIAGLSAAIALERAGYSVAVIERAPRLERVGAALSLWPNALAALDRLGVLKWVTARAAPFGTIALRSPAGDPIMGPLPVGGAVIATRAALQQCLVNALGTDTILQFGQAWVSLGPDPAQPEVEMADGSRRRADLVVDAGGIRSPVADRLLATRVTYRGYAGVLALTRPELEAHGGESTEYWGDAERFGLFDVGGGARYWFYMRNAAASAPPPELDEIQRRATGWPADLCAALGATDPGQLIPFAVHARTLPRRLGRGRIICVGDAAHAMEPNLGQGACSALEDAAVLGALAARLAPSDILPAFERHRLPRVRALMRQSAAVGRLIHHPRPIDRLARRLLPRIPLAMHQRRASATHRIALDA